MSINDPIETLKLSHKDVTLDYTQVRQGNSQKQQNLLRNFVRYFLVAVLSIALVGCVSTGTPSGVAVSKSHLEKCISSVSKQRTSCGLMYGLKKNNCKKWAESNKRKCNVIFANQTNLPLEREKCLKSASRSYRSCALLGGTNPSHIQACRETRFEAEQNCFY